MSPGLGAAAQPNAADSTQPQRGDTNPTQHTPTVFVRPTSTHALTDPDASHDSDELAAWISELAWFGLRGIRPEDRPTLA